jgi:ADP-heptose:LPS heptosyltransferase
MLVSILAIGAKKIFPDSNIYIHLNARKEFCQALIGDLFYQLGSEKIKDYNIYYSIINNRTYAIYNEIENDPIINQSIENQNKDFGENWQERLNSVLRKDIEEYSHNIYIGDLIKRRFLIDFNPYELKPRLMKNFKHKSNAKNYITINTCCQNSKKSKMWPEEYWNQLINYIKYKNKYIQIYHLGAKHDYTIKNKFINYEYFNNINIFDSLNLMYNSMLHIGTEGTFIHAASVLGNLAYCINGCCGGFYMHPVKNIKYFVNKDCGCKHFPCGKYSYDRAFYRKCGNGEHLCMAENKPETIINYMEKNFK